MNRLSGGDFVFAFSGLAVGTLAAFGGLGLSGGGHGWNSAAGPSMASIVGAPLAAVAWFRRREILGRWLAAVALVLAVLADLKILSDTLAWETEYVARMWESHRHTILEWGALFASWQVLAAIVLLFFWRSRSEPVPQSDC